MGLLNQAKFAGITLTKDGHIQSRDGSGPVAGAHAVVDTAGEIDKRITATRLILTGPIALAWRKKKDQRELYLIVEGPGYGIVKKIDPDKGMEARQFAAAVNAAATKAGATPSPAEPAPPSQPFTVPPAAPTNGQTTTTGPPPGWAAPPAGDKKKPWRR
jgi:hypothetical protein